MPQVEANGLRIEVEQHGDPAHPPILLIMGLATQLIHWPPNLIGRLVGAGYRVITFDNRDIGLSQRLEKLSAPRPALSMLTGTVGLGWLFAPYDLQDMADDTAYVGTKLPFNSFEFVEEVRSIEFNARKKRFLCDITAYRCTVGDTLPTDIPYDGGCDQWEQDCPEGEKCTAHASDDTLEVLDENICAPIQGDDQLGDPCDDFGTPRDGNDSCAKGLICLEGYSQDGPRCESFCGGQPDAPDCGPGGSCQIFAAGVATLCLRNCDPLDATSCGDAETCSHRGHVYPDGMVCQPHQNGDAPAGSVCTYGLCDMGLVCHEHGGCPDQGLCCTELCDLATPSCSDPLASCVQLLAPGYTELGACEVP